MKTNFLFIVISLAFIFSSCSSTFFMSTLSSTSSDVEQVENGDFLIEKDSLWIAYCFNGADAPVQITVFNKSSQPLYVDWNKSAIIMDGISYSYGGVSSTESYTTTDSYQMPTPIGMFGDETTLTTSIHNEAVNVSYIPPQTKIHHNPAYINLAIDKLPKDGYTKATIGNKHGEAIRVKRLKFGEDNTPLKFRSYLTIFTEDRKSMIFDQEFYLSSVIKSSTITPKNMPGDLAKRGDLFYIEKPANNSFWEGLAVVGIIAGSVAVSVALDNNYDDHYHYHY